MSQPSAPAVPPPCDQGAAAPSPPRPLEEQVRSLRLRNMEPEEQVSPSAPAVPPPRDQGAAAPSPPCHGLGGTSCVPVGSVPRAPVPQDTTFMGPSPQSPLDSSGVAFLAAYLKPLSSVCSLNASSIYGLGGTKCVPVGSALRAPVPQDTTFMGPSTQSPLDSSGVAFLAAYLKPLSSGCSLNAYSIYGLGGTKCVPVGSALRAPVPQDTTPMGPRRPDPEENIYGSHLRPALCSNPFGESVGSARSFHPASSSSSGPLGPLSLSAQAMGSLSSLSARVSVPPPLSVSGGFSVPGVPRGVQVRGGSSFSGPGVADPQESSPPRRTSTSSFIGGLVPTFRTPARNPYVGSSRSLHTDPGGFRGGSRPPPFLAPPASGPAPPASGPDPARRPDPEEDVPLPPRSGRSSFPSLVSFGGSRSGSSVGGYHGGRSSSSSSGSRGGISSSVPSLGRPARSPTTAYDGSGDLSTVDDLSVSTFRDSILTFGSSFPIGCTLPRRSLRLQNMEPEEQVSPSASAVPPPRDQGAAAPSPHRPLARGVALDPDADSPSASGVPPRPILSPSAPAFPPPHDQGAAAPSPHRLLAGGIALDPKADSPSASGVPPPPIMGGGTFSCRAYLHLCALARSASSSRPSRAKLHRRAVARQASLLRRRAPSSIILASESHRRATNFISADALSPHRHYLGRRIIAAPPILSRPAHHCHDAIISAGASSPRSKFYLGRRIIVTPPSSRPVHHRRAAIISAGASSPRCHHLVRRIIAALPSSWLAHYRCATNFILAGASSSRRHHLGRCIITAPPSSRPVHHRRVAIISAGASSPRCHHLGRRIIAALPSSWPVHYPRSANFISAGASLPRRHHLGRCIITAPPSSRPAHHCRASIILAGASSRHRQLYLGPRIIAVLPLSRLAHHCRAAIISAGASSPRRHYFGRCIIAAPSSSRLAHHCRAAIISVGASSPRRHHLSRRIIAAPPPSRPVHPIAALPVLSPIFFIAPLRPHLPHCAFACFPSSLHRRAFTFLIVPSSAQASSSRHRTLCLPVAPSSAQASSAQLHRLPSTSSLRLCALIIKSSTPSSHSPRHRGGSSFSSSPSGITGAVEYSSRPPILGGSASLAHPPSVTHEIQDVSSLAAPPLTIGSPSSSSPGGSSIPLFWRTHGGSSFVSFPSSHYRGGSSSSSSPSGITGAAKYSSRPPILGGSASLAIHPSATHEVQDDSSLATTPLTVGRALPLAVNSHPSLFCSSRDVSGGAVSPPPAPALSRSTASTTPAQDNDAALSEVDALGTSFMAAYLFAPVPTVLQGMVSLSPMGGDLEGRSLSVSCSNRFGGSVGSARSFHPASLSPLAPSRSTRSVGPSSCPPESWEEPGEQFSSRAPSFVSGRVPSSIGYGGHYGGQVVRSPSSPSLYARLLYGGSSSSSSSPSGIMWAARYSSWPPILGRSASVPSCWRTHLWVPLYSLRAHLHQLGCVFLGSYETVMHVYFPGVVLTVDTSSDCHLSYELLGKTAPLSSLHYVQPRCPPVVYPTKRSAFLAHTRSQSRREQLGDSPSNGQQEVPTSPPLELDIVSSSPSESPRTTPLAGTHLSSSSSRLMWCSIMNELILSLGWRIPTTRRFSSSRPAHYRCAANSISAGASLLRRHYVGRRTPSPRRHLISRHMRSFNAVPPCALMDSSALLATSARLLHRLWRLLHRPWLAGFIGFGVSFIGLGSSASSASASSSPVCRIHWPRHQLHWPQLVGFIGLGVSFIGLSSSVSSASASASSALACRHHWPWRQLHRPWLVSFIGLGVSFIGLGFVGLRRPRRQLHRPWLCWLHWPRHQLHWPQLAGFIGLGVSFIGLGSSVSSASASASSALARRRHWPWRQLHWPWLVSFIGVSFTGLGFVGLHRPRRQLHRPRLCWLHKAEEGIHEFRDHFEGNLHDMSWSAISIPLIPQTMLFSRALLFLDGSNPPRLVFPVPFCWTQGWGVLVRPWSASVA